MMSIANVDFWGRKFWHHRVHERLGETLYYFLVRVRPLDLQELTIRLRALIGDKQLGGISVYPIFGAYDLLVRVWLHPSIAAQFRGWLSDSLRYNHSIHPFAAEHINKIWYDQEYPKSDLLEELDQAQILAVQSGRDVALLQKLLDANLIIQQNQSGGIQFFISMYLEEDSFSAQELIANGISRYLQDGDEINNAAIYRGFGFCSILFEGQVQEYVNIAKLTNQLGREFNIYSLMTETYLVQDSNQIISNETIGQATFFALTGRDLFASSIIPELYQSHSPKRIELERILRDEAFNQPLTQKDKKLLHDYLLGYLEDDATQMATTLFTFFFEFEQYLRLNYAEFISRKTHQSVKEFCEQTKVVLSSKLPTLVDTLNLYSLAIKHSDKTEKLLLTGDWADLVGIRNAVVHGMDILPRWSDILKALINSLPKVRHLLLIIEDVTGNAYAGTY